MLVPHTKSIGTPTSSMYFSAPTSAAPFAPPPESTRPTVGRFCVVRTSSSRRRIWRIVAASPRGSTLSVDRPLG